MKVKLGMKVNPSNKQVQNSETVDMQINGRCVKRKDFLKDEFCQYCSSNIFHQATTYLVNGDEAFKSSKNKPTERFLCEPEQECFCVADCTAFEIYHT